MGNPSISTRITITMAGPRCSEGPFKIREPGVATKEEPTGMLWMMLPGRAIRMATNWPAAGSSARALSNAAHRQWASSPTTDSPLPRQWLTQSFCLLSRSPRLNRPQGDVPVRCAGLSRPLPTSLQPRLARLRSFAFSLFRKGGAGCFALHNRAKEHNAAPHWHERA